MVLARAVMYQVTQSSSVTLVWGGCNGACSAVLETCGCAQFSARVTADQSGAGCALGRRGRRGYGSVNFLSWFAISSPRLIPQH
jgi:hypothetical protein